jgi:hypothetical protein
MEVTIPSPRRDLAIVAANTAKRARRLLGSLKPYLMAREDDGKRTAR